MPRVKLTKTPISAIYSSRPRPSALCKTSAAGKFAPVAERHPASRNRRYQKQERDYEIKDLHSWFEMGSAVLLLPETSLPGDQEIDNSQRNPGHS